MQERHEAVCKNNTCEGQGTRRTGQREELSGNKVASDASADSLGSSGARMTLQSCPTLWTREPGLYPPLPITDWSPGMRADVALEKRPC